MDELANSNDIVNKLLYNVIMTLKSMISTADAIRAMIEAAVLELDRAK